MKYHLGCGTRYFDGYVNIDNPPSEHSIANVKADIFGDLITVKLDTCDEIRSHHVFEHFSYSESIALLVKWTRALKIDGVLIVDIPDIEVLSQELVNSIQRNDLRKTFKIIRLIYGSHEAEWAFHINGWSQRSLAYVLEKFGFEDIGSQRYGDRNALFPNCGILMQFKKVKDVELEKPARDILSFYTELPAQQDLLDEFNKQFTDLMGKI